MNPVLKTAEGETRPATLAATWEADSDFVECDAADSACLPALAQQYAITDLQHWIDLCA